VAKFIGLGLGQLGMLAQVALAMLLGAVIGFEREIEDKPAGLRDVGRDKLSKVPIEFRVQKGEQLICSLRKEQAYSRRKVNG